MLLGNYAQAATGEKTDMENNLTELIYRQIGSANRIQIIINQSSVTVSGQGGGKRAKFIRTEKTCPALWKQVIQQVSQLRGGELQSIEKLKSKTDGTHATLSLQTRNNTETSPRFSDLELPDKLRSLLTIIFSAQSPLEEIAYYENGMSESLKIRISRERFELETNRASVNGDHKINRATPADYWETLIAAVKEIEIVNLLDIEAPQQSAGG